MNIWDYMKTIEEKEKEKEKKEQVAGGGGGVGVIEKEEEPEDPLVLLNESIEEKHKEFTKLQKTLSAFTLEGVPQAIQPSIIANYNKQVNRFNSLIGELQINIAERDQIYSTLKKQDFVKKKQFGIYQPQPDVKPQPQESGLKDIWDAFRLGASSMVHKSKQYFTSALPNMIFRDLKVEDTVSQYAGMTENQVNKLNIENRKKREAYKEGYIRGETNYNLWLQKNPELQPREEWEKGVIETIKGNPKILTDPAYWGYVAAESAAFTLGVMGTVLATTAVTGNPLIGLASGVLIATPMQTQELYEDLIDNGATEKEATKLAMPIGGIIAAVEVMGDLPILASVSAPFKKLLFGNIRKTVVKSTIGLLKKGIKRAALIEVSETLEEVVQGAIQDATVRTVNENRDMLENIPETVVHTLIATAPFSLVGLGSEAQITSQLKEKVTSIDYLNAVRIQLEEQGFVPRMEAEVYAFEAGIDKVVKSIQETGEITPEIANQLKVMNPVDTGLVFQQLSMVAPAVASKVAPQFVELIPQRITKIPKAGEEMTPEELEQFEKLKEAKIIPKEEIEPTKKELEAIEKVPTPKEKFMAKMEEEAAKIKPGDIGEKFVGKAYRTETYIPEHGAEIISKMKTAQEKLNYDASTTGNPIFKEAGEVAKSLGIDLNEVPIKEMVWVAPDFKTAEKYNGAKEFKLPEDTIILAKDDEGGFLVLKNSEKYRAREIKPIEEPEKIEPEPTPEEIRTVFMDKENLETTVKNREYFLGKFGKLFTETKKAEDTLIKQKFNEMNMLVEYEEDEIYKLAFGKEKMRIPETTKTEWMEGLGKGKYMQVFRTDKNLQYPDEVASNLGISENELREQIIERIRTAPKEVTLESAKQALIDEGSSVFMQVTAQMDAYKILLNEIEGGEYSFDTPQNVKRLNAKISALKSDSKKLMDEYEKKITEIQKKGIEEKFEELKKGLEAREKVGIEMGIKKGLKVAKAELKGRAIKGMPKEEIKEGNKLIKQIQVMVKDRGFTKKQFSDIKMTHGGARSLSGKTKRMTIPQLKAVLKAVEAARPHRIGWKKVITPKTEKKIQSLKDNLIEKLQMTEETYQTVLKDVGIYKEPKYIDAKNFITEEKGKELIYRLIDESNILRVTEPLRIALEKNPEAKKIADDLDKRIKLEGKERLKDPHELNSMRKYIQIMEGMTDAPFFSIYQDLIDAHLENRADLNHLVSEFDEYRDIIKSEEALKRVESWILAKSNLKGVPEVSKDITDEEVTLAKKIQGILKDYETKARTEKFLDNIEHPEDMPQYIQYRKEINKAKDIYESKGYDDLVEYMKTQEWGVIKNSYDPLQVVSSKIRLYKAKAITLGKTHIKVRKDIEYKEQDKNIIQRMLSYKRQMDNLSVMRLKIRAFVTLVDKNLDKFKDPNRIRTNIEVFFRELKGYDRPENWFDRGINRLYAQAMTTIIMGSPALSFRNLGQNFGLGHDKLILIDPRNKPLAKGNIDYLDTYVQQAEFMRVDWFMTGEKPLPGLKFLTDIIKKINLYPRSDIANRHWGFWGKINQVRMAFDKNVSLAKKIEGAKFSDMTLLEQKRALQILSKDGEEAMEEYVTRVYVDDTHFIYERAQRSPAEMGRVGRLLGNLMLFPRAYWEKLAQHSKKMTDKRAPFREQVRAFKVISSVLIGGMLVSAAYKKVTGRRKSPYDPLELLAYEPGGLAVSTIQAVSDIYTNMILASKGDERALAALTTAIPEALDMFIPFYNYALRGVEAMTDTKNIDKLALRKMRMLINKEYQVRGGAYELERNAMEKWQYFLSGAGIDVAIKEREKEEKEKLKVKAKIEEPKGFGGLVTIGAEPKGFGD